MKLKRTLLIVLFLTITLCFTVLCCCKKDCAHEITYERVVSLPTCETEGRTEIVCEQCQNVVETKTTSSLNHDWDEFNITKQPTEQTEGVCSRICKRDSSHVDSQIIPKLESGNYLLDVTPSSCTTRGRAVYTHAVYGTFTVDLPFALHTYDDEKEGYCKVCERKYYSLGITYDLSEDGTFYIVSNKNYKLNENDLVLPHSYKGLPVKEIASEGFAYRTWIKSVTIPEYVETIGSGAFNGCGLAKVYFNAVNCSDFKQKNWVFLVDTEVELVIGCRVERLPQRMFYPLVTQDRTVNLTKITFEENSVCKYIGDFAFNKTSVANLVIPDSVEYVGENAFYNTALKAVRLGENVKTLGNAAFGACKNLSQVIFGSKLESVGNDCFNYCSSLLAADLSETKVQTIGLDAFKGCLALKTVALPNTLESIGKQAFFDCASLYELDLGNGLQYIGEQAFENCTELQSLTIPQRVQSIGCFAFANCEQLKDLHFNAVSCDDFLPHNMVFANVAKNGGLTVVFGNGVKKIPARLFYSSSDVSVLPEIVSLKFSGSVESVGAYAFFGTQIDVFEYGGTQKEWDSVLIAEGNETLLQRVK